MPEMVRAAHAWQNNGVMIAEVSRLGYLNGKVCDLTYGSGTFWSVIWPNGLVMHDARTDGVDFRMLPEPADTYDAVVFDPPYKLNGTPDPDVDWRYGIDEKSTWQDRMELMRLGLREAIRVTRRYVLMKCQAQVCSGAVRWQDIEAVRWAEEAGARLIDRFDMLGTSRPQPMDGREQKHAHGRPSTLLVFVKTGTPQLPMEA